MNCNNYKESKKSIIRIDNNKITNTKDLYELSNAWTTDDTILIASPFILTIYSDNTLCDLLISADIVHNGLKFGGENAFDSLKICSFNWLFINPNTNTEAISWKSTSYFILFNAEVLMKVGGFDFLYESSESMLMDFCYRVIMEGGKSVSNPKIVFNDIFNFKSIEISKNDICRFAFKHLGAKSGNFFRFHIIFTTGIFLNKPKSIVLDKINKHLKYQFKLKNNGISPVISSYSAIIPTIDRYDYIVKSIESLLCLSFPPSEIIVIDQTEFSKRKHSLYLPFIDSGVLKVIYLDEPGQSSARNLGLEKILNDWVLLFEDDAEALPTMVDAHVKLISDTNCDVSNGIVISPGFDETSIPIRNRKFCVSDVFTTGNAFLRKSTISDLGGFDTIFDRGPGADDDLGRRLYLKGKLIVYNYKSIEIHHKARSGGMRVHGVWSRLTSSTFGPFPPLTQLYVIWKFYPKKYHIYLILNILFRAKKKYSLLSYFWLLISFPIKLMMSINQTKSLVNMANSKTYS